VNRVEKNHKFLVLLHGDAPGQFVRLDLFPNATLVIGLHFLLALIIAQQSSSFWKFLNDGRRNIPSKARTCQQFAPTVFNFGNVAIETYGGMW
jgi:hypothetical protein